MNVCSAFCCRDSIGTEEVDWESMAYTILRRNIMNPIPSHDVPLQLLNENFVESLFAAKDDALSLFDSSVVNDHSVFMADLDEKTQSSFFPILAHVYQKKMEFLQLRLKSNDSIQYIHIYIHIYIFVYMYKEKDGDREKWEHFKREFKSDLHPLAVKGLDLVIECGVDISVVYSYLSDYFASEGKWVKCLKICLQVGHWEWAHEICVDHLASEFLLTDRADELQYYLQQLFDNRSSIRLWDSFGDVYFSYLQLIRNVHNSQLRAQIPYLKQKIDTLLELHALEDAKKLSRF
ncbi:hypothetical protein RFI_21327 [Reticulomyxa filosa]|uniref:Uncharacterized protein n=1 Tax=Reticulomyxa filosa TaxID=46433 RepID=X6MPV3_RETFI|nr:hypothetical protein RFI_21327 [Reticulomyxa filosa]|eukprot:ETO16033.1 hypothetical protein RFI_21327 [Reticulomyxa filosa]